MSKHRRIHALPPPPENRTLPQGFRARISLGATLWAGGRVLVGGSPWKVSTLAPAVQDLVLRLRSAGAAGVTLHSPRDRTAARVLLDRGFAECAPHSPRRSTLEDVDIVIPVLDDPDRLRELLATLPANRVLVVDDGSTNPTATEGVALAAGARILRHDVNRGPAAARNTGLHNTTAPIVAFIDADCLADPTWPTGLLRHFDDPAVAAAAPRIKPINMGQGLLERYESSRSSLDMGGQPELVRPGARLGFVPSAALVVRRSAIQAAGFDEDLRLGEDVDLIWRLAESGWLVRYDPTVTIHHRTRTRLRSWLRRKVEYGTSAPALEQRHPGQLAPARTTPWSVITLSMLLARRPLVGVAVQAIPFSILAGKLNRVPGGTRLAARVTAQGLIADFINYGQVLRREWWPVGAAAIIASPWSRSARLGAAMMLIPLGLEWIKERPAVNPAAYAALRLVDDGAYGTGVLLASFRAREWRTLTPRSQVKMTSPAVRRDG